MVFLVLRKVSLAFDVAVFFSDFLTENVLISRELNVLTIFSLISYTPKRYSLVWHIQQKKIPKRGDLRYYTENIGNKSHQVVLR